MDMANKGINKSPYEQERHKAFANRLMTLRVKKGWSQSELARRAALHVPDKTFGRDNISKYEKATSAPLPLFLMALAKALDVSAVDLMPERAGMLDAPMVPTTEFETTEFEMKRVGKDRVWIRLRQEVSAAVALQIMELVHNGESDRVARQILNRKGG